MPLEHITYKIYCNNATGTHNIQNPRHTSYFKLDSNPVPDTSSFQNPTLLPILYNLCMESTNLLNGIWTFKRKIRVWLILLQHVIILAGPMENNGKQLLWNSIINQPTTAPTQRQPTAYSFQLVKKGPALTSAHHSSQRTATTNPTIRPSALHLSHVYDSQAC